MAETFFPELEEHVLAYWKAEGIFQKALALPAPKGNFVFYEGPPYANGQPGVHHMVSRAYKDCVARYKTMQGFHVGRRAGWDTHGLPVEMAVEKLLGVKSKRDIEEKVGVEKFVAECRKNVFLMKGEWEKFTERMAYWVDLQDAYVTMTPEYIESCWWIFSAIAKRGLLYKDFKVVPFCTRCGTALSSHEMAQGYKKITDNSVYLKFELLDGGEAGEGRLRNVTSDESGQRPPSTHAGKTYILAWTTTPWTLPGNVALAVDPNVEYLKTTNAATGERFIFAKALLEKIPLHEEDKANPEVIKGEQLVGKTYRPLFDFVDLGKETGKKAYYVVAADFVTTEDGTGVVHTAVMYGEDDFTLGAKLDLPQHHTVDVHGKFTELVKPWAGKYVKDPAVEKAIVAYLQAQGKVYAELPYEHDYPFCWRCDMPLLYYAKDSWFFKTTAVRDHMLQENAKINWVPAYLKDGRFGEWLENVQDWAISRERYWGVPLPIWACTEPGCKSQQEVIGSFEELRKRATLPEPFDPHRPFIDQIQWKCSACGGEVRRVPDVADVWFDSGSMPLAQWHYPFEHQDLIDSGEQNPADFISEGIEQTRGWIYTLLAVASLLGRPAPYKNVISLGLVNDAAGKKMSKRLGNFVLPKDLFPKFGSDVVRFYLYTVSQAGEFKNFDPRGVDHVVKKTFLILWNVLSFYRLYAPERKPLPAQAVELNDRWLLARLDQVTKVMTEQFDAYDLTSAGRSLASFITELSTWYVRRSRDRFRQAGPRRDTAAAYLGYALETTAKLLAPFAPMLADRIYRDVHGLKESVHLDQWPAVEATPDASLLTQMDFVRAVVEAGHALRKEANIRVRQPLPQVVIVADAFPDDVAKLIAQELNVKEVHTAKAVPTGAEWRSRAETGFIGVALDTTVTDELRIEGLIRELIRHVNALRKEAKLTRQDKITVTVATESELLRGIIGQQRAEEVRREAGALSIALAESVEAPAVSIAGETARIRIEKTVDGTA